MKSNDISVISIQNINNEEEEHENGNENRKYGLKDITKASGLSVLGIIVFSLLFSIPWTIIPRTNSIIYQAYWMELLFPTLTNQLLVIGSTLLNLTTWFREETLMSINNYWKLYCCSVTLTIGYILCYVIWSVFLQFNHPLPNFGNVLSLINLVANMVELWFLLPSDLLADKDFRQKLRTYMLFLSWIATIIIQNQVQKNHSNLFFQQFSCWFSISCGVFVCGIP